MLLLVLLLLECCESKQGPHPATRMEVSGGISFDGSERTNAARGVGFADVETVVAASRHRRQGERGCWCPWLGGSVVDAPRSKQRDGAGPSPSILSFAKTTTVAVDNGDATPPDRGDQRESRVRG